MTSFACPDCEKPYGSMKASMLCQCDQYDANGRPKQVRGSQWLA